MNTVIHFGAGNIGRGFIGGLLALSGYHVVFADINSSVIHKLNTDKTYKILIVDTNTEEQLVENVSGVHVDDEKLIGYMEKADIMTTAVGPVALPKLAANMARGLRRRRELGVDRPINIIACENMFGASDALKAAIYNYLSVEEKSYCDEFAGFPNSVVDRIVPPSSHHGAGSLEVEVEPFYEWVVDKKGFRGGIPEILGMTLTENLLAYVERKLLTLNTGHAVTAYLGKQMQYKTIRESILDATIYKCVYGAMIESGEVLVRKHGFDKKEHWEYIYKIIKRFKNPYLDDRVERVGREPLRKLSGNDRLIKPLLLAEEYGVEPVNLIIGTAAAFHFQSVDDQQAVELQGMISKNGIAWTISEVTGLSRESRLAVKIMEAYRNLKDRFQLEKTTMSI